MPTKAGPSTGEANYRRVLRAAVRGLWGGVIDYYGFYEVMFVAIDNAFYRAWYEGAAECGIKPEELTPDEQQELQQAIATERGFIGRFADTIEKNSKAEGGKLTPLLNRVDRWVIRYNDIRNRAKMMACGDQKLEWVLGISEHCDSCLKLAGKIKRASYWQENDVRPQHPTKLLCMIGAGGVSVCQCALVPTDRHLSPGPLPSLP